MSPRARLGTSLVRGLVFKETVVLDQWGKKQKFGFINWVNKENWPL